ncbi:HEAT repeat domain-containing protein [Psychrobacillus sp. NPDC058041]|uniref:HEAT repeat domain-containing protein n=1 Tax=Psychrobacillus sp. NPDC058041 TaxID=3346310 RepID=UPI0036DC4CBF
MLGKLDSKIADNKVDEAIAIVEELGSKKIVEAVHLLIHHVLTTKNAKLRNSIAIALADIGSNEAIEPLISLLKNPNTIGARGTILYALESFPCTEYIELFAELLGEDSFEVSRQAFILIDSHSENISSETKEKCISIIQKKIDRITDQKEFLIDSLEELGWE